MLHDVPEVRALALTSFYRAYRSALAETRGRPEWKHKLGAEEIRRIVTRAIISAASDGVHEESQLSDLAVDAVKAKYMAFLQ